MYLPAASCHVCSLGESLHVVQGMECDGFCHRHGYLESTIVVYLRRLYYHDRGGFDFPLVIIDTPTLWLELGREACTIVMLATVGSAAGAPQWGNSPSFCSCSASGTFFTTSG